MEVDYSDINVNSDRLENERKHDTGLEQDLEKFTILLRLQQLQTVDDEAQCYRTFVLYEAAKRYGYKLNWPTDALQYASTLFQATSGHLCTREPCQAVLFPEKRQLYHNGVLLKRLYMHPCNGNPCVDCSVRRGEAAPHQQLNHPCVCQCCDQFSLPKGTTFDHPETGRQLTSSGTVFVCRQTGIVHICPEYERCDRTYINTNVRTQGYVCRISGRYKGNSITYIPEFDENRKIATSRIKKMKLAEDEDDENQNYISDEEFDFVENNDDEETGNPADEYMSDPRDVLKLLPGSKDMSLEPLPRTKDMDESEYDDTDESGRPNDLAQRLPGMRRMSDITRLVHTKDIGEIVQRLTTSPKRKASPQSVPVKRQRTPRAKLTPENKVDQYMKNSGDRLQRVQQIIRMLTCNANKITMYREALWDASCEGGERVDSAKRKSTKCELTTSRCRTIWFSYVLPKLPPEPYLADKPLEIQVFVEKILNAWELCANSPIAVETGARKRSALNLPKIAFASLYMIADGGHKCKCSLDPALLGPDTVVDGVNLCKFIVTVLPGSRVLPKVIVPREELNTLRSLVRTNISFSGKTEFEGKKLLKQCVLSRHASIHQSLINDLALPDTVRVERLREYIAECLKLQC